VHEVQRLFSSFPNGAPGAGLLILRFAIVAAMLVHADSLPALLTAVLLAAGFMTPAVAGVATVIAVIYGEPSVAGIAVALALLGPGAYSVDARLFGRREIVIED
jgi:predicted exporter